MNRSEMVATLAQETKTTKTAANEFLSVLVAEVSKAMNRGDTVTLAGFGTFYSKHRAARMGHNPMTGEKIKIAAHKCLAFRPSRMWRETLNADSKKSTSTATTATTKVKKVDKGTAKGGYEYHYVEPKTTKAEPAKTSKGTKTHKTTEKPTAKQGKK
jgi:DNA-binding protein HU-alpha